MIWGFSTISGTVLGIWSWWRRAFLFDLHALALFRIVLGLLVLSDLLIRSGDFTIHYTESGVLPLADAGHFSGVTPMIPLHRVSEVAAWQGTLFGLGILFAVGIVIGLQTRVCVICVWLIVSAIHARNPLVLYGADTLLMALLLWGFFLPLGDRWGIDSMRFGWRGPGSVVSVGTVALVLQIVVVYWGGFLSKSGEPWWNGEAVGQVLRLDQYTSATGRQMLDYPGLAVALTWVTLMIEAVAPLLLLVPKWWARLSGVGALALLQVGFALFMELGLFPFVSLAALIPFLKIMPLPEQRIGYFSEFSLPTRIREAAALIGVTVMLLWNLGVSRVEFQRTRLKAVLPEIVVGSVERLRLDQSWSMFSPEPPEEDGWLVFEAVLADGEHVNLWRPEIRIDSGKPDDVSASFGGDRWKAYLLNLIQRRLSWRRFSEVLVSRWNSEHGEERSVSKLSVRLMKETWGPDSDEKVESVVLLEKVFP